MLKKSDVKVIVKTKAIFTLFPGLIEVFYLAGHLTQEERNEYAGDIQELEDRFDAYLEDLAKDLEDSQSMIEIRLLKVVLLFYNKSFLKWRSFFDEEDMSDKDLFELTMFLMPNLREER